MSLSAELRGLFRAGGRVSLRRVAEGDLEYPYKWENDPAVWPYGDCGVVSFDGGHAKVRFGTPPCERFSRSELREFIENQQHEIDETGQVRFMICRGEHVGPFDAGGYPTPPYATDGAPDPGVDVAPHTEGEPIGFVDLFDYDGASLSAGVGILICEDRHRGTGYGSEALRLLIERARRELGLRELWCDAAPGNGASLALFAAAGFREIGRMPDGTVRLILQV